MSPFLAVLIIVFIIAIYIVYKAIFDRKIQRRWLQITIDALILLSFSTLIAPICMIY